MKLVGIISAFVLLFCYTHSCFGQENRGDVLFAKLDSLSKSIEGLNEEVEVSLSNTSLTEFIRSLGENHELNIYIDNSVIGTVSNTFKNIQVKNVLAFLASEYALEIEALGEILIFTEYIPPIVVKPIVIDTLGFFYNQENDLISLNLKNDSIEVFAAAFSDQTPYNLVLAPNTRGVSLSIFLKNSSVDEALNKLAFASNLNLNNEGNGFYTLEWDGIANNLNNQVQPTRPGQQTANSSLRVTRNGSTILNVYGRDASISEIINACGDELKTNYFLYDEIKETLDILVENATFEEVLSFVLKGTDYTFTKSDDKFFIGDAKKEGLRETKIIEIENRSISQVIEAIPEYLKEGLVINVFNELNAVIASGSKFKIDDLEVFIKKIDRVVPMVYLEVILLEVNETKSLEVGINAGVGEEPVSSGGTVSPGVDYTLNGNSVNQIITGFNNLGVVNLGQVTPNFYLSIKALESNGIVNTRSTPKLTALNGQKANLNIGRTEYYVEVRNDFIGTQNPSLSSSTLFQPVEANTSLDIIPFISKDEQITLEIKVLQSDFTERITDAAPPGQVQREFTSTIRIKNGDMIILGGLDNDVSNVSTEGLPWVSRVPILKWFFGRNIRATSKQRLSILIKPVIIY